MPSPPTHVVHDFSLKCSLCTSELPTELLDSELPTVHRAARLGVANGPPAERVHRSQRSSLVTALSSFFPKQSPCSRAEFREHRVALALGMSLIKATSTQTRDIRRPYFRRLRQRHCFVFFSIVVALGSASLRVSVGYPAWRGPSAEMETKFGRSR